MESIERNPEENKMTRKINPRMVERMSPTIKRLIKELIDKYPLISDKEIGKTLNLSPPMLAKLLDEITLEEILLKPEV